MPSLYGTPADLPPVRTTPRLACPNGNRPDVMIDPDIEQQIHLYFRNTRHVLV